MTTTKGTPAAPTTPAADADSRFFWNAVREHKLLLQECARCKRCRFPPMPSCPYCGFRESALRAARGEGSVYSWIVVHRAFDPAFQGEVPYTLASVDLAEGGRVVGRLESTVPPVFGMRVKPTFFDHAEWTELRFQPIQGNK